MEGRPTVEWRRYGGRKIWMLFPDPADCKTGRLWFFIQHDKLFTWMKDRHRQRLAGVMNGASGG